MADLELAEAARRSATLSEGISTSIAAASVGGPALCCAVPSAGLALAALGAVYRRRRSASRIEAWLAALVVLPGPVIFGSCLSARLHGLITAFGGVAYVNASERAGLLDAGIQQSTLFPATTVGALVLLILLALPLFAVAVDAARRDAVVGPRVLLLCAVLAVSGLASLALVVAYRPWSSFDEAQSSTEKDQPSVDRRPARPSWG